MQPYKTRKGKTAGRLVAVFKCLAALLNKGRSEQSTRNPDDHSHRHPPAHSRHTTLTPHQNYRVLLRISDQRPRLAVASACADGPAEGVLDRAGRVQGGGVCSREDQKRGDCHRALEINGERRMPSSRPSTCANRYRKLSTKSSYFELSIGDLQFLFWRCILGDPVQILRAIFDPFI